MPALKEAAVFVTGQVMDIEPQYDYADGKRTTNVKGQKVIIATGNADGFAAVTVRNEDFAGLSLALFDRVAWVIRYGAWSRNDNAQNSTTFVRTLTADDFDRLYSASGLAASTSK